MTTVQSETTIYTKPSPNYLGVDVEEIFAPLGTFETIASTDITTTNLVVTNLTVTTLSSINFSTDNITSITPNAGVTIDSNLIRSQPHYLLPRNVTEIFPNTVSDIALVPNGVGSLCVNVPDGAISGGNSRGNNCVDLQSLRTIATAVADGTSNTISGGFDNTIDAGSSFCSIGAGQGTTITGCTSCSSIGSFNTMTGVSNSVIVGHACTAVGNNSYTMGNGATNFNTNSILLSTNGGGSGSDSAVNIVTPTVNYVTGERVMNDLNIVLYSRIRTITNNTWTTIFGRTLARSTSYRARMSGVCTRSTGADNDFEVYSRIRCDAAGIITGSGENNNSSYAAVWQGPFAGGPGIGGLFLQFNYSVPDFLQVQVQSNDTEGANIVKWSAKLELQYISWNF